MHSLGAVASLPLRVSRDGRRGFCKDWAFLSQNRFGFGGYGFPAGSGSQVTVCNVGDLGSIPGSGRSPGEGNPLLYSIIPQNPEFWRIPWTEEPGRLQSMGLQSQTQLSNSHTHTHTHTRCIFSFLKNLCCSPQWLSQFIFPTVQEGSLFSTLSRAFIIYRLCNNDHSDWCEVISYCSFDLHFSNNQ